MLIVVSPAKKLDMTPREDLEQSQPIFPEQAADLAQVAGALSQAQLQKLMGISEKLALLNQERFANFGQQARSAAAFVFAGDTYQGLEAMSLDAEELRWAQAHLRILSGLYGLLRPLDAIEPYRLEMGSRLKTPRGKSLYEYWGDRISLALNAQAEKTNASVLVNCASQEYFNAVDQTALNLDVVTPVFMESTDKGPKIVSFYAKKARGAMARFIITRRLSTPESLRDFDLGGYAYQTQLSTPEKPVFLRG